MSKSAIIALLGLSLAAASPAFAQSILYQTGFEAPTFTAGLPLVGQDSWASIPITSPNAAIITTDQPFAGKQAVRVRGADLVPDPNVTSMSSGYYSAIGSYRRRAIAVPPNTDFDVAGAGFPVVRVQAAVRVDGPQSPQGKNFFSASVAARAVSSDQVCLVTDGIGELAISSDGKVYGYSGDDFVPGCPSACNVPPAPSCVASFLVTAPITLGAYHTLAVNADFVKRKFSFCLDGQLLEDQNGKSTFPFPSGADTNLFRRGSLIVYARPDTPQLNRASFKAHDDNFSITTLSASQTLLSCPDQSNQNGQ